MDLILYLLLALIVLPLLLLFFPVKIYLKARVADGALEHILRINWLGITFNPKRFSRLDRKEKENRQSKRSKKGKKVREKDKISKTSFLVRQAPQLLILLRQLLCDLWKAVDISSMKVNADLGFADPANTGVAYGFIHAAGSVVHRHIPTFRYDISPVFDDKIIDISVSSTIRIKLYRIVYAALHLLCSGNGRRAIWILWKMRSS
ncbi:DUF2953 domain-containing protein [Methanohalophilus sp.]|uniref:DUF2953 domain-containing protein n=1 Tax=Methanohalophilus sp. TaxID=1966352 RepID=UPI00262B81B4|nr:DUF2953 domain-containing protein [Methanohalophilus sp.]MDK2892529.1 hypothetical protein [Methanohalophilus sp.]